MKTISFKALLILAGLMLLASGTINASAIDDFKRFVGTEFSTLDALYLMGGIIVASLVLYVLANHFGKEDAKTFQNRINYSHPRRHHHQHRVIKKTS